MVLYQKKEECCGCNACMEICPEGAVSMVEDREGFYYPQINKSVCSDCGKCKRVCPIKSTKVEKDENLYFGVQVKDEKIRFSSSSGGIFSILAYFVISRNGIVYGAGYDEDMKVIHQKVEDLSQLEQIKRTKYVQSDMSGIYNSIEMNLRENRWVLFCGTPCQVQALKLFLNRQYERLILVDLVCYGVPSPGVWKKYVKYLERKHGGRMTEFVFRDKRNKDDGHTLSYIIDGKEYVDSIYEDNYCRMYFKNYILRMSCFNCKFCRVYRNSDFTIGDFWGIKHIRTEFNDGMGTSLVIVHSDQARRIWNEIQKELFWFQCKKEELLQPRLLYPTNGDGGMNRIIFMLLYKILPFSLAVKLAER